MKTRFPAEAAKVVVRELLAVLTPEFELMPDGARWVKVAGSLRRKRPEVGDIELVYVPRRGPVPSGLFMEEGNRVDWMLGDLIARGVIAPRPNRNGQVMWGEKNKLAVHRTSGIPIDFFATTIPAFWNYLVCRTGSAETNQRIAQNAQERGLKWHPYHAGFEVLDFTRAAGALKDLPVKLTHTGQILRVSREEDVFLLAGLDYLPPEQR
jgi:DNA polymerase/3'-5' exonuclease PolX